MGSVLVRQDESSRGNKLEPMPMLSSGDRDVAERSAFARPGEGRQRGHRGERRPVCRRSSRERRQVKTPPPSRVVLSSPAKSTRGGPKTRRRTKKKGKGGPAMSIPKKAARGNDVKEASKAQSTPSRHAVASPSRWPQLGSQVWKTTSMVWICSPSQTTFDQRRRRLRSLWCRTTLRVKDRR